MKHLTLTTLKNWKGLAVSCMLTLCTHGVFAQAQGQTSSDNRWSLQECIDYAWANSLTIKQQDLQMLNNQATLNQSKLQQLPTLNASGNFGYNTGRSIDRFTNQFVTQTYNFNGWNLNANLPLFGGLQTRNTIKQNTLSVEASRLSKEQSQQDVGLNTVLAYLTVLNNEELVEVAKLQVQTSQEQVSRTDKLVQAGTLPINNLYDLQSQLANDKLNLVNAENNVRIAKVNLMQTMNLPVTDDFIIEKVNIGDPILQPYNSTPSNIYQTAVGTQPGLKASKLLIESSEYRIRTARGGLYPSLSAFFGANTNYVSLQKTQFIGDGTNTVVYQKQEFFIDPNGQGTPNIRYAKVEIPNGTSRDFTYFRQLDFNLGMNYGLNLQIPIFNGWQTRTQISRSIVQKKQAELDYEQGQITLRQNIEQAYNNMTAASQRFIANQEAVKAQEQSFNATKLRMEAGLLNSVDFSLAQTNLGRAKANLVQAKYDYVFRVKILDFYQNKPITFE